MRTTRLLILLLALGTAAACADAPDAAETAPGGDAPTETAPASRAPMAADGQEREVVYVDVRTPEEFSAGHVEGAINIPHTEMGQRYEELEPYAGEGHEIVVYCRSGRRSGIAQQILEREGFGNVENGGGLRDLRAQGVPTTR